MDIEKLIDDYRKAADKWEKRHPVTDTFDLRVQDALREAATALSTLQAENEQLRAEMKQERAHRLHAEKHADAFLEDCKRLNAELENYRKGHCSEGGCAAEKDRDLIIAENDRLRAELEQVKVERDAAVVLVHEWEQYGRYLSPMGFTVPPNWRED